MIIAVTGATGIVGRFVCEFLGAAGHTVRGLHRQASRCAGFTQKVEWVAGQATDKEVLRQLLCECDAVVHCAFSHAGQRYRGGEGDDPQGFLSTNLAITQEIIEQAQALDVSRVIIMSSRAVFGRRREAEDPATPIVDDHPLWPDSLYGALKVAEEALVSAAQNTVACALRPTGVYGVGYPQQSSKWYQLAVDGLSGLMPAQNRLATEVHGQDVGAAVLALLEAPSKSVAGRGFNCSDIAVSTTDVLAGFAARLDFELPELPPANELVNPMACHGLKSLGWQPGGMALFESTLDKLAELAELHQVE